jgi:hypothetical protein
MQNILFDVVAGTGIFEIAAFLDIENVEEQSRLFLA